MMLDAAIKPDARMRPLADLVKMAAFMSTTVSCVPYALDGNTLRPVTGPKTTVTVTAGALSTLFQRRTHQFEAQFPQLFGVSRSRRIGHDLLGLLVLGKRDHLADRLLTGGQHDHPVQAIREATVRRRAVTESVEQETESSLGVLARHAQPAEDPLLHFRIVDPDAARAELGAIEDQVIGAGAHPHRLTGQQGNVLGPW